MIDYRVIGKGIGYGWLHRQDAGAVEAVEDLLQADDYTVAGKINNQSRRQSSLLARGLVHYLAGCLLDESGYGIAKTESGCPFLQNRSGQKLASVSLSHSHDIVAAVVDLEQCTGIDVEYCGAERDYQRIVRRIFPPATAEIIDSPEKFYQAWCLYEAWGKVNNLQHVDPEKNDNLMQLIEDWFGGQSGTNLQHHSIIFFTPAEHYAGCVFRAGGTYVEKTATF